jgi:uncharacterized heparinase superfamily protein
MTSPGVWWRTLKHLKLRQVTGRVRFRLARPRVDPSPAPTRREFGGEWLAPARRPAILEPPAKLRVLNCRYDIDARGWDDPAADKLLRYNVHYFDDLCADGAAERRDAQRALLLRWIAENPAGHGTAWEPYPTSLRIVNWVKWFLGGVDAPPAAQHSLAIQARWLRSRLEIHLLGNHLFANAKALMFAGAWFAGDEAAEWYRCGLSILDDEMPEQILTDGGQFERSPMYHALALEDVLDLLNLARSNPRGLGPHAEFERGLRENAERMLYWARCMLLGDGRIGLFNDAAEGIAPAHAELERYAGALGVAAPSPQPESVISLPASGYLRVARGRALALLDVAPVGPDYLPAHAHADTLSFELSLGARPLIVNGGTSCYGLGARRAQERSTAAHSTVEISGENSSEVWGGFRVGRRARPSRPVVEGWNIRCSHDGYRFLPGAPVHSRAWRFLDDQLVVEDAVSPALGPAIARYHLAPGLDARHESGSEWRIFDGPSMIASVVVAGGAVAIEQASHSPRFGVTLPTQCLALRLADGRCETRWRWSHT